MATPRKAFFAAWKYFYACCRNVIGQEGDEQ
jgi:hypothetical protein